MSPILFIRIDTRLCCLLYHSRLFPSRSIWSSNWSEETTPDTESACNITEDSDDLVKWYDRRAREIEERSGLASYALHLITLAKIGGGVTGLGTIMFNLLTLDTLIYDINVEGVTLKEVEKWSLLETCTALMKMVRYFYGFESDYYKHSIYFVIILN